MVFLVKIRGLSYNTILETFRVLDVDDYEYEIFSVAK